MRQRQNPAWLMGVLNCTPDSFSDGTKQFDVEALVFKAKQMVAQGADLIDVGGESTRPDAKPVSVDEELSRVIPVIQMLSKEGVCVSVDTMKAKVMAEAIDAGATLVNDVSALQFDADSMAVVASSGVDVCLMHMQGSPQTMQNKPEYKDVLSEVLSFFEQRVDACLNAGIKASSILLDPGIGFGKRLEDNLQLIANLNQIKSRFGFPILLGTSRKSFLGLMTGAEVNQREIETAVSSAVGVFCGADMLRVHDCAAHRKTALVAAQLSDYQKSDCKQVQAC
jgi:dihydropteroate synthase